MGGLVGLNMGEVKYSSTSSRLGFIPNYGQVYGGLVGVNFGLMDGNSVSGSAALVPLAGLNYGVIQ